MKTHFLLLNIAAALGIATAARSAAEEKSWKGEPVLYTKAPTDIKISDLVDGKLIDFSVSGRMPLFVFEDLNGKVCIDDGGRAGWAKKSDFVPMRDALVYFDQRVRANANDTWALYMRGWLRLAKGFTDTAIKDFDEYIRLEPTASRGYLNRGSAWAEKKDFAKALNDFTEAIRIDRRNAQAFANRGHVLTLIKEYCFASVESGKALRSG